MIFKDLFKQPEFETICFKRVYWASEDTILPTRGTQYSAGYDFYAQRDIVVPEGLSETIWLDVKVKMPNDMYLKIENRSSMMSKHDTELFCSGIIDADYYGNPTNDGNIGIRFLNHGKEFVIQKGERICQGIFLRYNTITGDITSTKRVGGFGSTNS